jgi:D-alanyl-D-alanine carboxypeptidase
MPGIKPVLLLLILLFSQAISAQPQSAQKLKAYIDSAATAANYPGLSVAVVFTDNTSWTYATGYADKEMQTPLRVSHKLMQGSVGKTYAAALMMRLIHAGKIGLDDKISGYLGHYAWYPQLPNAPDITVRMLLNHTSGIMRYEFKEAFAAELTRNPDKIWKPEELLKYIFGEKPDFKAGEGWDYSDTNYILLGMIIEEVSGKKVYDLVVSELLKPLQLKNTHPSNTRTLKGLAQGYAGNNNPFGNKNKMIENGRFIVNPQFEWTGGGFYSTTSDIARWGKYLFEGRAFDASMLSTMLEGVSAPFGPDARYGLGVMIRPTAAGNTYGHGGFFPGYLTEMLYFPDQKVCIALQTNTSDIKNINPALSKMGVELMKLILEEK